MGCCSRDDASAEEHDENSDTDDAEDGIEKQSSRVNMAFRKLHAGLQKGTWRHKLAHTMENPYIELVVLLLVLADVVLVSIEGGIDHHIFCVGGHRLRGIPHTQVLAPYEDVSESAHFLQVGPPDWADPLRLPAGTSFRGGRPSAHLAPGSSFLEADKGLWLGLSDIGETDYDLPEHGEEGHDEHDAAHGDHGHGHGDAEHHGDGGHAHGALGPPGALVCEDRNGHEAHHIVHTCHIWSIIILCIFVVELTLKLIANPKEFCSNPFHVLDFVVVVLSLLVDTVVMWYIATHRDELRDKKVEVDVIASLLIACRVWRVVRIVHGIFEVAHSEQERRNELKKHNSELKERAATLEKQLSDAGMTPVPPPEKKHEEKD